MTSVIEPTDEQHDIIESVFPDVHDMEDAYLLFQELVASLTSEQLIQLGARL